MDLSLSYLGLNLPHPLIVGASPMVDNLDTVRRLEDAGAAALVMHSLFEEQITREQFGTLMDLELHSNAHAEAASYLPEPSYFTLGPETYLEQIRKLKSAVGIPIIASLNGTTPTGWVHYGGLMEEAGADALELNTYEIATDPTQSAALLENQLVELVKKVRATVTIPIAVKLSPTFTSLPNLARRLHEAGANGLVLFNRFLQPDFDLESLQLVPRLYLSDARELLPRLHALALLHGSFPGSLSCSGGVHDVEDALKAVMAGAHSVQVVSSLLIKGPGQLKVLRQGMAEWLEAREYESLRQAHGSMSLSKVPNPGAYERASYMRVLQGWRPEMLPH
ncbi:MAG TPA: dihydroorotate dehydrogenase-like protein [Holophagaceae bacterium]|nr:dihydroorotate dehydrogenase-like protein [Holophagaceae bacterium]